MNKQVLESNSFKKKKVLEDNNTNFKSTHYLIPDLKHHLTLQEKMIYCFRLTTTKKTI